MNWLLVTAIQLLLDDELQQINSIFNTEVIKERKNSIILKIDKQKKKQEYS